MGGRRASKPFEEDLVQEEQGDIEMGYAILDVRLTPNLYVPSYAVCSDATIAQENEW